MRHRPQYISYVLYLVMLSVVCLYQWLKNYRLINCFNKKVAVIVHRNFFVYKQLCTNLSNFANFATAITSSSVAFFFLLVCFPLWHCCINTAILKSRYFSCKKVKNFFRHLLTKNILRAKINLIK